ncbi:MAG TPA: response regulator transcription factor [Stellaceae bacterium]|nr:response regulator transcription factor [Stellaceae bacterium]
MQNTVVLVDDDQNLLNTIGDALEGEGFAVRRYNSSTEALEALKKDSADVAVLDVKMPGIDGFELLARLRKDSNLPVIFLTSKDEELDELLGLRMGADDYMTKPVTMRLLIERIRALIRRRELTAGRGESEPIIEREHLRLDPSRHECSWKDQKLKLTVTEFLLLKSLALRPGHIKTRRQLMDAAYGENIHVDDRTIDSHVKRLRAKFKAADAEFALIETLYGIGYRYRNA